MRTELRNKLNDYVCAVKTNTVNTNTLTQEIYDYVRYIIQQAVYMTVGVNNNLNQVSLDELQNDILIKVLSPEFISKVKTNQIKAYQQYVYVTTCNEVRDFVKASKNKYMYSHMQELPTNLVNAETDTIYYLSGTNAEYIINHLEKLRLSNQLFKVSDKNSDISKIYMELLDYVNANDTTTGFINYCKSSTNHKYETIRLLISRMKLDIKLF